MATDIYSFQATLFGGCVLSFLRCVQQIEGEQQLPIIMPRIVEGAMHGWGALGWKLKF